MKRKHKIIIEVESDYGAAWSGGDLRIDNAIDIYCKKIKEELSDPRSKTYMHFGATAAIYCTNVYLHNANTPVSGSLPPLSVGSRFAVAGNGYVRYATVVEVDAMINVSPFVDKYFTIKMEKDGGNDR